MFYVGLIFPCQQAKGSKTKNAKSKEQEEVFFDEVPPPYVCIILT